MVHRSKTKTICAEKRKLAKLTEMQAEKNPNRPALVSRECHSNSKQEEGDSDTQSESSGTRKNLRRRKPMDKMGGVMSDSITKENPRGGEKLKNPSQNFQNL